MSLAARLDGIKIQGHRCAIRKKMRPSKERRKYFLGCDAVGTEREDPALAFTTSPKAHWLKLRADNV